MEAFTMAVAVVVAAAAVVAEGRQPVLHRVGGERQGWKLNVNYTEWASHEHFYVGDWLYFGFDKHVYSVLEVNKTGYTNCIEKSFIKNITRGGRDVFNLTEPKPFFFISGAGFCARGVKLAVDVVDAPPDPVLKTEGTKSGVSRVQCLPCSLALLTVWISFSRR